MAVIDGDVVFPGFDNKSQGDNISYSRTETVSQTVTKTNNVKLGGGNITNVYLGTNQVKAIYLGDNLIIGTQTVNSDVSAKYTLSIEIDNDNSLSTEAQYDAYSYILGNLHVFGKDDPVEQTINTYMHSAYSYIKYLITTGRVATPSDYVIMLAPAYSVSKGFAVKNKYFTHSNSQYDLTIYNSSFYLTSDNNGNPLPFAQFSVYTDYQKINCNVWRSNWYPATEPPTETPTNSTATITLSSSISGDLKCVGVTMRLTPAGTTKTINVSVVNGNITGNNTVTFDNLTNGVNNYIQFSQFIFTASNGIFMNPANYGNLIATVNGISTTISSGSLGSLSGRLTLDCTSEQSKQFIISIRIQQTF